MAREALVRLGARLRLTEDVTVRHRLRATILARGDPGQSRQLSDTLENPLDGSGIDDEGDDAMSAPQFGQASSIDSNGCASSSSSGVSVSAVVPSR